MNDFYVENSRQLKRIAQDANTYFHIHIDLVEEADFCLAIRFHNGHAEPLVLPFGNHTRKAERLGFVLCHEGVRLKAYNGIHVLSSSVPPRSP